jgi:hypothetical protein
MSCEVGLVAASLRPLVNAERQTMDDQCRNLSPAARDVAGAWLVCVLIGMLALALSSTIQGRVPPASTMAETPSRCGSDLRSGCSPPAEAAAQNPGAVVGLHWLSVPELRPGNRRG